MQSEEVDNIDNQDIHEEVNTEGADHGTSMLPNTTNNFFPN